MEVFDPLQYESDFTGFARRLFCAMLLSLTSCCHRNLALGPRAGSNLWCGQFRKGSMVDCLRSINTSLPSISRTPSTPSTAAKSPRASASMRPVFIGQCDGHMGTLPIC